MSALGNHTLFVSAETLGELEVVLLRLKFDAHTNSAERAAFFLPDTSRKQRF